MEFERRFWVNAQSPTGFTNIRPRSTKSRLIADADFDKLNLAKQQGKSNEDIAKMYCCSPQTVKAFFARMQKTA